MHFVVNEGAFDGSMSVESQRRPNRARTKVGDNDLLTHEIVQPGNYDLCAGRQQRRNQTLR